MSKKRNSNALLIITYVLTIINLIFTLFVGVSLAFNLFGIVDYYNSIMSSIIEGYDMSMYMTSFYVNLILTLGTNIYASIFYYKGIKYRVNNKQYGRMLVYYAVIQILFSTYLPGLFALITGLVMINRKPAPIEEKVGTQSFLSDYKLSAMSEAVTRLKELRASGAISEEEYYANLNKILEG